MALHYSQDLKGLLCLYKSQNEQNTTTIAEEIEKRIVKLKEKYSNSAIVLEKKVAKKLRLIHEIIEDAQEYNQNILEKLNNTQYMKVILLEFLDFHFWLVNLIYYILFNIGT